MVLRNRSNVIYWLYYYFFERNKAVIGVVFVYFLAKQIK